MPAAAQTASAKMLGSRLITARQRSEMTLKEAMIKISHVLPRSEWVTDETIRRYEAGMVSEVKADPILLAALAYVYEVPLERISPVAARSCRAIMQLLGEHVNWLRPNPLGPEGPDDDGGLPASPEKGDDLRIQGSWCKTAALRVLPDAA